MKYMWLVAAAIYFKERHIDIFLEKHPKIAVFEKKMFVLEG